MGEMMIGQVGRSAPADVLTAQRLTDLERICRGLSHEANNWLYTMLGQTEMAEQHMRRLAVALRYADRQIARLERAGAAEASLLPAATIRKLRQQLPRKTIRRRLDGLRKARHNAEQLAAALHTLHMFAAARATLSATVDLNAAVRGAVDLLRLSYYRGAATPPQVMLNLAEGLPAVAGSSGLVMGIIIDLAAAETLESVQITTRRDGEAAICEMALRPVDESGFNAALAAARLCGGVVTTAHQADGVTYTLWLPTAGSIQALRSR